MLRFFNTLTRRKEEFQPIHPGEARLYTCGPTVYNYAHIGNYRTYLFEDILRRYLKYRGFKVVQVMNLTDIDDKTIRDSRKAGMNLRDFTEIYKQAFFEDLDTLNIERAEYYPAATEHIAKMVELIKRLEARGYAYRSGDSIYFDISKFPAYGRLAHLDPQGLRAGASGRVDADEYDRESVRDFALWKEWSEDDGDVFWETELSKGRPGWHIECSAMSMKYLGETFDIHTGGVDNLFPHHENEIAQSEAATGQKFVNYWLHSEHLLVGGRKMAKSFGNFYTLRDLIDRGLDPMAVRYALISTHYRQQYNFTFEGVEAAKGALDRLRDFVVNLDQVKGTGGEADPLLERAKTEFEAAMDDDLNISAALAAVFDLVRDVNKLKADRRLFSDEAARAKSLMQRFDSVLGVIEGREAAIPQEVMALVAERQTARGRRDFKASDALRDQIAQLGYLVEDTPQGPRVKKR